MSAHALPGFDSWLLRDLPGDSGVDRWEESYCARPDAEIARDYAGEYGIPACVGEHAADDDAFMRSWDMAEAYAKFHGFDSPEAYLADRARNDGSWLQDRYERDD